MLKKLAALSVLVFIAVIEPFQAMAQQPVQSAPQPYYGPGPWHMWNDGYGWHVWGMLPLMVLFMLLVCGAVFLFARRPCGYGTHHSGSFQAGDDVGNSALRILNERLARGEIQKDEYADKKMTILSGTRR